MSHNINFSDANIGGVNIDSTVNGSQIGTQHNYASEEDITKVSEEIQTLLHRLQQTHSNDIQSVVRDEIRTNANFYERVCFMLQAGAIETLKVIFPPVGIPIEMLRGWVEASPIQLSKEELPPGGF
jgi:hypothetical protein